MHQLPSSAAMSEQEYEEQRQKYRQLLEDLQEKAESSGTQGVDPDVLRIFMLEGNQLFVNVKRPREAALDAQFMKQISQLATLNIRSTHSSLHEFKPQEFAEKMKDFFGGRQSQRNRGLDEEAWKRLGEFANKAIRKCYGVEPQFASFVEKAPKVRAERVPKVKDKEAARTEMKQVAASQREEVQTEEVTRIYGILKRCFKENGNQPVSFFPFVINPDSFVLTIENVFHTSFLLRDQYALITDGSVGVTTGTSVSTGESGGSVPTDLTVTSDGVDSGRHNIRLPNRRTSVVQPDRAELMRTVELLRLQLEAREEQLNTARAQHSAAVNRLQEERRQQLLVTRRRTDALRQEALGARRELSDLQARVATELATLTSKCAALQAHVNRLSVSEEEVKSSLKELEVGRAQYEQLRDLPERELSLRQFAILRVHDLVWPVRASLAEQEEENARLQEALKEARVALSSCKERCSHLSKQSNDTRNELDACQEQIYKLNDKLREEDYRVQNFARVKSERDNLEINLKTLNEKLEATAVKLETVVRENASLSNRLESSRAKARRLENECGMVTEHRDTMQVKLTRALSETENLSASLRVEKDHVAELRSKLDGARTEVELLKEGVQEREELRESVMRERDRCSRLMREQEELRAELQSHHSTLAKERRIKTAAEEDVTDMRREVIRLTEENCKLSRDIVKLKSDKSTLHFDINTLRKEHDELRNKLTVYEELEGEYEKSLKSLPAETAKTSVKLFPGLCFKNRKVIEHTARLSSKVLKLERDNEHAKKIIQQLTKALSSLSNSLYSYKSALSHMGDPVRSLHQKIVDLEDQVKSLQDALASCSSERDKLERRNTQLCTTVERFKQSLDSCTAQPVEIQKIKSELNKIKEVLLKALKLDQ